jgi:hypothetical protein
MRRHYSIRQGSTRSKFPPPGLQKLAPVLTEVAGRTYMSVEGLAGHPQLPA